MSDFVGETLVDDELFVFVDKSVRVSDFRLVQDFAHMYESYGLFNYDYY